MQEMKCDPIIQTHLEFDITPPRMHELRAAIKRLKNNKTPGPDGVPPELFKALNMDNLVPLLQLLQLSDRTGTEPRAVACTSRQQALLRQTSLMTSSPSWLFSSYSYSSSNPPSFPATKIREAHPPKLSTDIPAVSILEPRRDKGKGMGDGC